ncbi:hypothetical protein M404DRAFT_133537 [Pisolithus tinctorius Marx 270]|uniref:Uncharacterized protein n=1 Tax=Pisolithus tinctorius Marx 270 TaxID=870435 RepID=A0A0C3P6A8_PISTI|nr:hypothetical protein M404DRAFT_133537 [Pisolithus tinctorius Marx 270]
MLTIYSFCLVPSFGRDTIRKFNSNVSDLSRLAARDFEDILQCIIPMFEGLLPEPYNSIVLDLLFKLATWHTFGKLCMHTEMTLFHFDNSTTCLGITLWKFSDDCCAAYKTYNLPHETAACAHRQGSKVARAQGGSKAAAGSTAMTKGAGSHKQHMFNMGTYKLHALGDYVASIWLFGTTDNYSTQVVS